MSTVKEQYEVYPYPARDPKDERKRLITGSPSLPAEIDHFLFEGRYDPAQPMRALFAGGGTGDGLIQFAALMAAAGRAAEITYIDLSKAARGIAEARAKMRGLTGITFVTGSLLEAGDHGPFDYIDCCGVLHHLPDPQAGFDALAGALAPDGGIGLMVYAPYGRAGVYPLQEAFGALWPGATPSERLALARQVLARLPEGHLFKRNPHLVDHHQSDAGFYDLLLHSQDRPFTLPELSTALQAAGLALVSPTQPALYNLNRLLPEGVEAPEGLDPVVAMGLAEKLRGTIKTHIVYAASAARASAARARPGDRNNVPHLKGLPAAALARHVAANGRVPISHDGGKTTEALPKQTAPLIAQIDGKRSLAQIAAAARMDPMAFGQLWARVDDVLGGWGLLLYSRPETGTTHR